MTVFTRVINYSFRFQAYCAYYEIIQMCELATLQNLSLIISNTEYFFCLWTVLLRGAAVLHAGILHWILPGLLGRLLITPWLWTFGAEINIGIGQLKW